MPPAVPASLHQLAQGEGSAGKGSSSLATTPTTESRGTVRAGADVRTGLDELRSHQKDGAADGVPSF